MFLLDKKSHGLVKYLLQLDEPETVMAISKVLNQSRRKIYYHLEKINEALPEDVPHIVAYPRVGIVLNEAQKVACRELLAEVDDYSYVMSREERSWLIMSYIALSQERVTIDKIMLLADVSRNTILNDLNDIRHYLAEKPFQISLKVTRNQGYYLDCNPLDKFRFFYELAQNFSDTGNQQLWTVLGYKKERFVVPSHYFSTEVLDYFQRFFANLQTNIGKKISQQDRLFIVRTLPYFLLNYRNMFVTPSERELVQADFILIRQRIEYKLAQDLADQLKKRLRFTLDDIEIGLIAMILLSFRKDKDSHVESHDYDDMRRTLESFLDFLTEEKGLRFKRRQELLRQLLTHSKALIYRKTYGITSHNGLLPYLKDKYGDLFETTKVAVPILEKAWSIHLTDDDIGYFAIHLGGELEAQKKPVVKPRALIICDDGVAIQKFLLTQCRTHLPQVIFEAIFTYEQFQSVKDLVTVDFIISTIDQIETHLPVLTVHAVLSDSDIVRLIRFAKNGNKADEGQLHGELTHLISQHVRDSQEVQRLTLQIEKLVYREVLAEFQNRKD